MVWGKTSAGKLRYYCPSCKTTRLSRSSLLKTRKTIFVLFKQYVLWGVTYEMLSFSSGYSIQYLQTWFVKFLGEEPPFLPVYSKTQAGEEAYLLIDGLWFGRYFVLMVYRQAKNLLILKISVAKREVSTKISKDLKKLKEEGFIFTGIVSDDGTGIVKAVMEVYPHTPYQICLAHMHRRIIAMLGKKPKDQRILSLRALADHVWLIESKEALKWWYGQVKEWLNRNYSYLLEIRRDQEGKWWYIHKGSRRAIHMMLSLPSKSFAFLEHPLMPKTTNELEAQFGHVGKRWLSHRGLKRERWDKFLRWFVYLYNKDKISRSNYQKD